MRRIFWFSCTLKCYDGKSKRKLQSPPGNEDRSFQIELHFYPKWRGIRQG